MAEAEKAEKTTASRVADVVVLLISLLILLGGFLGWRVYQANPQRNAYDLAVGIFNDAYKEVEDLRAKAEPLLDNCAERSGNAEACAALQTAYDSSRFSKPKKLSRITAGSTYKKESARVTKQTELARAARDELRTHIETVTVSLEAMLEQKIGPQRDEMNRLAYQAESEISATQDLINKNEGHVDDSLRSQAQEAVNSLQKLVDQAHAMTSENPEDYNALNSQLLKEIEIVTNWNLNLNNYYR